MTINTQNINIRNAKISDIRSMKKILNTKELGWKYSINYFKALIGKKRGIFLVAEHKSNIIGITYGEFNEEEDWAELAGIAILEMYRNQGIGSRLLREFEKIVQSKNVSAIETYAHVNTLAKHIDKLGYEKGGVYVNCRKELKGK